MYDRLGNPTVHGYDERGNVTLTIDAQGNRTTRTYDDSDNMLSETNALGQTTRYAYDAAGNRTSVTDALGNVTRTTYDASGNPLTETDPLGNVTRYAYDAGGNLVSTTNALGQATTNVYDANGRLVSTKDAAGNVTASFGYDSSGNMTSTTDAAGFTRSFGYDSSGRQTGTSYQWTNPDDPGDIRTVTTQTVYDSQGNVTKTIDPDGNESLTEYNEIARPFRVTDVLGNITTTTYDARGNVIETAYPDGAVARTVYDSEGRAVVSTSRFLPGDTAPATRTVYNSLGQAVRTERLAGAVVNIVDEADGTKRSVLVSADAVVSTTRTVYDNIGRVAERLGPREGQKTSYEYDDAGRNVAVVDALGDRTEYEYDDGGRRVLMRDALGREVRYAYDALGRQVKTVFPDGTFTATGYDALGRKVSETDQAGVVTRFEHDTSGRLAAVRDALGQYTRFTYDERGNRLSQLDANEHATAFAYDCMNRLVRKTLPMGQAESYAHDAAGNVVLTTDFKGQKTRLAYDTMNRLASKDYGDNDTLDVAITYAASGQRDTVTDTRGVTTYAYDEVDRLASVTDPATGAVAYTYDASGNRLSVTTPNKGTVSYTYDALDRLSSVVDASGETRYTYDKVGNRESVSCPNGTQTVYAYDSLNRLTDVATKRADETVVSSYHYGLAATGNRLSVTEHSGRRVDYTYDTLYRLTHEVATGSPDPAADVNASYTYDLVGNRLSKTVTSGPGEGELEPGTTQYVYDSNDRLTSETRTAASGAVTVTSYGYDANGSTTSKTVTVDGQVTEAVSYEYNHENRLARAETTKEGATAVVEYAYDQDGIRVAKTADGVATNYLIDPANNTGFAQVLEETDSAGAPKVVYTYGDDLVSQTRAGVDSFYHHDGQMSVRQMTDAAAAIQNAYTYDAWGVALVESETVENLYRYTGEQFDPNVGFYYLRARYYNPSVGRFHTVDPWEGSVYDPVSLHKYVYAYGDPVDGCDPTGKLVYSFIGLLVGVAIHTMLNMLKAPKDVWIGFKIMAYLPVLVGLTLDFRPWDRHYAGAAMFLGPKQQITELGTPEQQSIAAAMAFMRTVKSKLGDDVSLMFDTWETVGNLWFAERRGVTVGVTVGGNPVYNLSAVRSSPGDAERIAAHMVGEALHIIKGEGDTRRLQGFLDQWLRDAGLWGRFGEGGTNERLLYQTGQ